MKGNRHKKISLAVVPAGAFRHHHIRACAHRVGHVGRFWPPNLLEAAFSHFIGRRHRLLDCLSYRIYREKIGHQMSKWLNDNGPKTEKVLMDWNKSPSPASLRDLPRKQVYLDGTKRFAVK